MERCWWCLGDPIYEEYHDYHWGKETSDEKTLFEMLSLELFQSGLSWITILRKQKNFKEAFAKWDISRIAAFDGTDFERLMNDAGIVRNRKKIEAVINNAQRYPELCKEFGSFYQFLQRYKPDPRATPAGGFTREHLPLILDEARTMSKDLKARGFKFTGPMTCMSLMQSVGVVNHHISGCHLAPK